MFKKVHRETPVNLVPSSEVIGLSERPELSNHQGIYNTGTLSQKRREKEKLGERKSQKKPFQFV